jgi:small subunit ribosomal protein S8
MNDPIADMIVRIKNAGDAQKDSLVVPYSKMKFAIANLLQKEGYLKSVSKKGKKVTKFIELGLVYENGAPKVKGIQRVSKFSKRIYRGVSDIHPVKQGYGILVLTTSKGVLTYNEAKKENVGGEVLFKIW